jgi:hypothetical protein
MSDPGVLMRAVFLDPATAFLSRTLFKPLDLGGFL